MSKVEKKQAKHREAALAHAVAMIAERGLSGLNAREVAAATGCSVGTVYNLFGNLDGLIVEANSETLKRLDKALTASVVPSASPRDRLLALARAYLGFVADNSPAWYAVFEHRLPEGERIPDWHLREHLALFRHVAVPLKELNPKLADVEAASLARSVWSAVHGVVSLGLQDRLSRIPLDVLGGHVETIVGAFVDGYGRVEI